MRISIATIVALLGVAGCGQSTPEVRRVSAQPGGQAERNVAAEPRAEMSDVGWPYTTKKYSGEFVHVAADGTEHVQSLGGNTVATIQGKVQEGTANQMAYELQYVRHRDGKDLYVLKYQTSPHHHTTVGPFGYAGKEVPIGNKGKHGTFVLRPKSR
jgi:hypothetical protein